MANPAYKEPYYDTDSEDEQQDIPDSLQSQSEPASLNPPDKEKAPRRRLGLSRGRLYFFFGLINLSIIWCSAIAFIILTPDKYISKFTLLIPGSGTGSSLNLDNLGQATTSVNSAYSSSKVDPKTNYKAIAMSPVVIDRAAAALGVDSDSFGKPKVKLIDQTTLLEISLSSQSAESAYEKSIQYYDAFEATLSQLRTEELNSRRNSNESILSEYRENVAKAQADILDFQKRTKIVSADQYKNLLQSGESLKQRRSESLVRLNATNVQLTELEKILDISPPLAAHAIKLQNDSIFSSMVTKTAEANVDWVEKQAVWGKNHPKVKHARARVDAANYSLLNRAKALTGIDQHSVLDSLYIQGDTSRSQLFQQLITLAADQSASESEVDSYSLQLDEIENRLQQDVSLAANLEDLERNHQVATAIYVSAAAKSDLGNSDIYASYPMTQLLMAPTRSDGPEKFTKPIAIAGAIMGSLLICLALLISWKRSVLLQKLRKRN